MVDRKVNVLVVDFPTGRSSALIDAYASHPEVGKVSVTSRNDIAQDRFGTDKVQTFPQVSPENPDAVERLIKEQGIDLVDVAQDKSVEAGIADRTRRMGVWAVGPDRDAGQLEWDKPHGRRFARRNNVLVPNFDVFSNPVSAKRFADRRPADMPAVVKAYGLAEGKGVDVANNREEIKQAIDRIYNLPGGAGRIMLIEHKVGGTNAREFSGYYMGRHTDGQQTFIPLGFARDYKRVFDGDKGPNTGGMGSVLYRGLISEELQQRSYDKIVQPTAKGLMKIHRPYRGVLYIGGMHDPDDDMTWLIEYNARWGDPEAEVVVPHLADSNDFLALSEWAAVYGRQDRQPLLQIQHNDRAYVSVAGCSQGYPVDYSAVKGQKITGLEQVIEQGDVRVYGAGIIKQDGDFIAIGGRIFHLVAEADTLKAAQDKVYGAMEKIHIPGPRPWIDLLHYRRQIGA